MIGKASKISTIVETAKSLLGRPYKYGAVMADAPVNFDCSLFTQYVFLQARVKLPRTAIEQAMIGKRVPFQKIKAGDLVFMKGELGRYNKYFPEGIGHVGIYIGENRVIHSERKRITGKYEDIYRPELIKEEGSVIEEDLVKFIKKKRPLVAIKRYI
ncbi:C40 family peptidase [Candidatus Giovannonibacteria bacterium]|nr:C40 family peptidase [Candidatus Giovannonibacteria bacterium]